MNDLKRQLLKRSIPVGRLAKFVDIDRAYCSRILNNKICPGDDIARRLAAAANIFTQRVGYYLPSDFSTNESINDDYDMQVEALEQNIARAILTYDTYRKSQDITAPRLLQDFEAIKRLNDLVENIAKVKS